MPDKTPTAARTASEPGGAKDIQRRTPPSVALGLTSAILDLQRAAGNRSTGRLLGGALLQPKLRIGPPGDAYEREADRVADAVLRGGTPVPISVAGGNAGVQRMCQECEEERLQRKCHQCQEEEDLLQPKTDGAPARSSTPGLEARVDSLKGAGRPLSNDLRSFFEPRFGHDFGDVRIHTGSGSSEAAQAVRARAFTVGNDVVFGHGEWSPETTAGKSLLAHELTHVVQQTPMARRKPLLQRALQEGREATPGMEAPTPEPEAPTPSPGEPASEAAPAEQAPAAAVVVEDDATEIGEGQMKKSEFLARLRPAVLAATEAGLNDKSRAGQAHSLLELWLGGLEAKDAEQINRDLGRLVSGERPTTAEGYIAAVAEKVRTAVATWESTGEIPPELSQLGSELLAAGGLLSGLASVFFKALPGGPRNPGSPQALRTQLGEGRPLDGSIRSRMESAFGRSFSHVRVHTDSGASGLATSLNAKAFTVGEHVAFGPREYQPGTLIGDALIAHELAHVAQQAGAREVASSSSNVGAFERDADTAAAGAVASIWGGLRAGLGRLGNATAAPRMRSGLSLQRCDTTPRLKRCTVSGPEKGECGAVQWKIRWDLTNKSPLGGQIVQKYDPTFEFKDCNDQSLNVQMPLMLTGIDASWFPYWESWQVRAGKDITIYRENGLPFDDLYSLPRFVGSPKGKVSIKGTAEFFEGAPNPLPGFAPNLTRPSGILPMSQTPPNLKGGTGANDHSMEVSWDCCPTSKSRETEVKTS